MPNARSTTTPPINPARLELWPVSFIRTTAVVGICGFATLACGGGGGGGSPTTPGSSLTLSASPTQIGRSGSATLTALALRDNGQPAAVGTQISFATNLGTVSPVTVLTDAGGRATSTLRGDGRTGTATVSAQGAGATAQITVLIETGISLLLTAAPPAIPLEGSTMLTVQAREANGDPAVGVTVRLTTTLGSLANPQPVTTNVGIAETTLRAGATAGRAVVTAEVEGGVGPARVEVSIGEGISLRISADPAAIGPTGATAISILALQANGTAVPTGTQVELTSTLGRLDNDRPATDALGLARTTLRADGRTGDARVTASVSGGAPSTVVVPIR